MKIYKYVQKVLLFQMSPIMRILDEWMRSYLEECEVNYW